MIPLTCRFDFPKKLRNKTTLANVYNARTGRSAVKVLMKRNHSYLNNYNPDILVNWRANMDLQLLCNPHAAGQYACAAYVSKVDVPDQHNLSKRILKIMCDDQAFCMDQVTRKVLYKCAMATVNATQTSAQECAWFLMNYKLVEATRKVANVNCLPPQQRAQVLQPCTGEDDQEECVWYKSKVDKLIKEYCSLDPRHPLLRSETPLSAADFITKYAPTKATKAMMKQVFL